MIQVHKDLFGLLELYLEQCGEILLFLINLMQQNMMLQLIRLLTLLVIQKVELHIMSMKLELIKIKMVL
ncbi:MAG: hypothetical protein CME98_23620 [Hyphomonas sp.]|nr:hypothetical protein [Hyphomonas sp.]